ncbi:MAG: hypothetical protein PQ975_08380 [Methanobacterium sp.]|jgi:hypothetical protein
MTISRLIERTEERRIDTYFKRNQIHKKRNDLKHTGAMALTQYGFSSISPYDREDLTVEGLNIHQVVSRNFCQMVCLGTSYFSNDLNNDELLASIDIEEIDEKYIPKNLALAITKGLQKSTTCLSVNDLFEESLKLAVCGGFALPINKPLLTPFTAKVGLGHISKKNINILLIGIEDNLKNELLNEANKTNMLEGSSAEKINLIQVGLGSLPMVANYIEQELPIATGGIDLVVIGNDGFAGIPIIAESYGTKVVSVKYQMDGAEFLQDAKEIIKKAIESFTARDPNYMYIDDTTFEVNVGLSSKSKEKIVYLDVYDLELVELFENNGYAVATIGCNVDEPDLCIHFPDLASMIVNIIDRKNDSNSMLIFTKATPQTITMSMFMRMIGVPVGFMDYPPIYGSEELVDLFFTHPAFSGKLLIHSNPQTMIELMKKENL